MSKESHHWIIGTGFSRGIGLELLKEFKKKHFNVIHLGRKETGIEDKFIPWDLSVSIEKNPQNLLLNMLPNKNITGFFYAAGMMPPLSSFDSHFWAAQEQAMRVNYFSCAELIEVLLPFMTDKQQNKKKTLQDNKIPFVAHLSSMAAIDPFPGLELYGATKAAALSYFFWLSKRFDSNVLTCLSIHPGTVKTDMISNVIKNEPNDLEIVAVFKKLIAENLLMKPEESAEKISSFLFQDHDHRKQAHGKMYAADQDQIF
jgi:short-subunit dehydrogenase